MSQRSMQDNESPGAAPAPTTIRVAILDEHSSFTEALTLALSRFSDIEVGGTASTISNVVQLCQDARPDVVVTDFQLPDGDAIECATELRDIGVDARFILLTDHALPYTSDRAVAAGFDSVLDKRMALYEIAQAIRVPSQGTSLPEASPIALTKRQQEVLLLLGEGRGIAAIAERLFISVHTARGHVKDVLRLFDASTQLEAVTNALRLGYLLPPRRD